VETENVQAPLDSVFDDCKEKLADDVLPALKEALMVAGFDHLDRHVVYAWAEEISAGIRPKA
jgi:hypothetical protein